MSKNIYERIECWNLHLNISAVRHNHGNRRSQTRDTAETVKIVSLREIHHREGRNPEGILSKRDIKQGENRKAQEIKLTQVKENQCTG